MLESGARGEPDRRARSASRTRAGRRTARRTSATRTRTRLQRDTIAVVHNGIIENYDVRCARCSRRRGHAFVSETDTEVLAHLIEEAFDGNLEDAVVDALAPGRGHVRHRRGLERRPGQDRGGAQGQPAARSASARASTSSPATWRRSSRTRARSSTWTTARWRSSRATATASSTSSATDDRRRGSSRIDWDLDADREGRLRALHAQGDLRAAADDRERDARPPRSTRRARRSSAASTSPTDELRERSTASSSPPAARAGTRR